jgi:uncharacterized protein (DUF736 family)
MYLLNSTFIIELNLVLWYVTTINRRHLNIFSSEDTMANIGSFKKVGEEYQGEIVTLAVQARGVRIVPDTSRSSDNAPTHRVYIGRVEIGAAWLKKSQEGGRDYLSLKLDDPSFNQPIFANLTQADGETYSLIWSRRDGQLPGPANSSDGPTRRPPTQRRKDKAPAP